MPPRLGLGKDYCGCRLEELLRAPVATLALTDAEIVRGNYEQRLDAFVEQLREGKVSALTANLEPRLVNAH